MKKLLGLLAAAVLMPAAANADVLNNVNLIGEIQTIASDVKHGGDGMYNRGTSARVLAGLSADLVEDVTANLMFQYANVWGWDNASGKTAQEYWDNVRLVEANVVLHNLFCCLEATVGRQFYGDEDSAVMYVGPNHYNAEFNGYTRSLDAVKVAYADDVKAFTMIAGKFNDTFDPYQTWTDSIRAMNAGPAPIASETYNLLGADFRLNITEALKLQVYGYDIYNQDDAYDTHSGFYGAKLALNPEDGIRLSAEYARNFGGHHFIKEHNDTGHMVKADVAADIEAVTVRGTFFYANDDFFALGNYTPGLLVGHLVGGFGVLSDIALFNVGFDVKPAEKWTVSLDGYSFQDHRMKHSAMYEADLTAKYAHNENVELFAGVGYVDYANYMTSNENVKGQLGMLIKF